MSTLKITQVRSTNERPKEQRRTMEALGLHGIRDTATHRDTEQIRGMIDKVNHLVEVEEMDGSDE